MPKRAKRERTRIRVRVNGLWEPEWNDEIIGWTRKFIVQNKWRTESYNGIDDLMQDAFVVFCKVRNGYPHVVEAPHFMKMYQTALWRTFMDKGRKLKNDILAERHVKQELSVHQPEMLSYNEGPLSVLLMEAPSEIRMLMQFMQDESNMELLRRPQRKRNDATPRQNIDQRLSSLLGIPYFPFREKLKQWLFT